MVAFRPHDLDSACFALAYLIFGAARGQLRRPGVLTLETAGLLGFGALALVALLVDPAGWCTIEIIRSGNEVRMIVANDGAVGAAPDRYSFGLRGLSERLGDVGGALHTRNEDGVFTLEATVPEARIDPVPVTP